MKRAALVSCLKMTRAFGVSLYTKEKQIKLHSILCEWSYKSKAFSGSNRNYNKQKMSLHLCYLSY